MLDISSKYQKLFIYANNGFIMTDYHVRAKYDHNVLKDVVDDCRIKHKDYFWCRYLYMMCHEWFIEHNYGPRKDSEWPERFYLHRFLQKGGEEIWIWWRFRKQFNKFIRYDLDVDWHIIGLESREVVKDGKKFKADYGEPELKIYAKIIFDQGDKFDKHPFLKKMKETFWQSIYYKTILQHRKQLYHDVMEFKQALKTYFNLKNWLPETEGMKFYLDENIDTPFYAPHDEKR
jgi:hypothetical protein